MIPATAVFAIISVIAGTTLARAQSLDLQATCASQARRAFEEFKNDDQANETRLLEVTSHYDYQSHYNTKLNRCLMLINRRRVVAAAGNPYQASITDGLYLVDANERRRTPFMTSIRTSPRKANSTLAIVN